VEKNKGVALAQNDLLNLKLSGNTVKALEDFCCWFGYPWQASEPSDRLLKGCSEKSGV